MTVRGIDNSRKLKDLLSDVGINYRQSGGTIKMFGRTFDGRYANGDNRLNAEQTAVQLISRDGTKLYGIFGEGPIDARKMNAWTDKAFDNSDISFVRTSGWFKVNLTFVPDDPADIDRLAAILSLEAHKDGDRIDITLPIEFNMPPGRIESIRIRRVHELEYFKPSDKDSSGNTSTDTGIDTDDDSTTDVDTNASTKPLTTILYIVAAIVGICLLIAFGVLIYRYFERKRRSSGTIVSGIAGTNMGPL